MDKKAGGAAAECILRSTFEHEEFRDGQLEAITAVVDKDVPNVSVLLVMGTEHGKVRHASLATSKTCRPASLSRFILSCMGPC